MDKSKYAARINNVYSASASPFDGQPKTLIMTDPEAQRAMLFIAEGYRLLAERAEAREGHKN